MGAAGRGSRFGSGFAVCARARGRCLLGLGGFDGAMPPPVLPGGARPPTRVPQAPSLLAQGAVAWRRQLAASDAAAASLREGLLAVPRSDPDADYLAGWADQVRSFTEDEVPPQLRGAVADFSRAEFASTPFAFRDAVPITAPAPTPEVCHTDYRPRHVCPDILDNSVAERWALWWPKLLADLLRYGALGLTPELSSILKGLLRQYLRLYGPESLVPERTEPLTNDDMSRILDLTADSVSVGGRKLNWSHPFWVVGEGTSGHAPTTVGLRRFPESAPARHTAPRRGARARRPTRCPTTTGRCTRSSRAVRR